MELGLRSRLSRALLLAAAFAASSISTVARADDAPHDTVHLTNGGLVRGTVMEEDPTTGVTIQMLDGKTKKIPAKQVKSVDYARSAETSTSPAPAPTPAPREPVLAAVTPAPPLATIPALTSMPASERRSTGLMATGLVAMPLGAIGLATGIGLFVDGNGDHSKTVNQCKYLYGEDYQTCGIPVTMQGPDQGEITAGAGAMIAGGVVLAAGLVFTIVGATKVTKEAAFHVHPRGASVELMF